MIVILRPNDTNSCHTFRMAPKLTPKQLDWVKRSVDRMGNGNITSVSVRPGRVLHRRMLHRRMSDRLRE